MDKYDLKVLCCLRQDGRMRLADMAKKTRIPISTLYDKIKTYEKEALVRHCAIVDFRKLGFGTRASLLLKTPAKEKERILGKLMRNVNVNALYGINNGYDFAVDAVFRNMQEVEHFVHSLQELGCKCEVHYLIDELKQEGFMTDPELMQLVIGKQ